MCAAGEVNRHRVYRVHAQHGGDAFERGKRTDAHHHKHDQRLEVACANANQGFVATT